MDNKIVPVKNYKVDEIIKKDHGLYIKLITNKYCPFIEGTHETNCVYVFAIAEGLCVRCDECKMEQYPKELIKIPNNKLSTFGFKNVNYNIIINNYNNIENNEDLTEIVQYNVFEDKQLNALMYLSLSGSSYPMSMLVYYLYKDRISYVKRTTKNNGIKDACLAFIGHYWREDDTLLNDLLSADLIKYYNTMKEYYKKQKNKNKDDTKNTEQIERIIKVKNSLQKASYKKEIMEDIKKQFIKNNRKFDDNLDRNPYLVGFENGVFDLKTRKFRDGKPEDMISLTVEYDYIPKYSKYKKDLMKFLKDILPDDDDREYLLKYMATGLTGINKERIFLILSGITANGKSVFKHLIKLTLGEYFFSYESTLLTSSRPQSHAAGPDLLRLNKKRMGIGSEPEAGKKINSGLYKLLTGKEMITARDLNSSKYVNINPTFKMTLECNKIPIFDEHDEAIWSRTVCLNFPITFVDNPKGKNEKKKDPDLSEKIELWKQDMMLYLIEMYYKYLEEGLELTKNIKEFTKSYKETNDIYLEYINERTQKANTNIHTSTLYKDFKKWFESNNPGTSVPNNRNFVAGIKKVVDIKKVRVGTKISLGVEKLELVKKNGKLDCIEI
jgi:putative DNA primase/helicase